MTQHGEIQISHLIKPHDFCEIVSEEFKDDGLKRGNYVYVAGQRAFPVSEGDMYTQRVMFICHKANRKGEISLEEGFFLIDPRSLFKLDDETQEKLMYGLEDQIERERFLHAEVEGEA